MDIISEKRYKQVPVVDLDILYVGGLHDVICLYPHDRYDITTDGEIRVWIINERTGETTEHMISERANRCSYKFGNRFLKVEDTSPLPE
jgi:hypothetical protein